MTFHIATEEDVREGRTADVYFPRTLRVLEERGLDAIVRAEFVAKSLPRGWEWAVLAGLDEAAELLTDLGVEARAMPEGTLFGELEPVLEVHAPYRDFCVYETALLGFLCQATGVATAAARCRLAAGDRLLLSFGARRLHPSCAPAVERAAYVGGCDGVATLSGAEAAGIEASGTMPHALVLVMGDTVEATRAFHEAMDESVPRVSLVDTFHDEKFEAIRVADELEGVVESLRLDTPGSRKGNFRRIFEEVRWELDRRGHEDVGLFASGGLDEEEILELNDYADGYGVGGAISAAPIVDFSMDIVEVGGEAVAKRGKWSGAKQVYRCPSCAGRWIVPLEDGAPECGECGGGTEPLLRELVAGGRRLAPAESPSEVRDRVLQQLREPVGPGVGVFEEGEGAP